MSKRILWIIAFGCAVIFIVFATYIVFLGDLPISKKPEDWGVFGDFVGGTANPILSFLTIVLLAITTTLQARQLDISVNELKLSREELELTRKELSRSASAQELSEKALKAQAESSRVSAQLATINTLMDYYSREISKHKGQNYPRDDLRQLELNGLIRRHGVLQQRLEQFYIDITGVDNE